MNSILNVLESCFTDISNEIRKGKSIDLELEVGDKNSTGDSIKYLDKYTNDLFIKELSKCEDVQYIASEEEKNFFLTQHKGKYLVALDPLDGSSNIGINITIGTIFGIFKLNEDGSKMIDGNNIVMAGYCLYSSSTQYVVATEENKIEMHILNPDTNIFEKYKNIKIPSSGKYYSINEGYSLKWQNHLVRRFVNKMKLQNKSLRFLGSMVADVHRLIMTGGCFLYPDDVDNRNGKLRLLYECYPMSYILKVGGGESVDGRGINILDMPFPYYNLHRKTPILMFGKDEFKKFIEK